jgi:hypothetical protein
MRRWRRRIFAPGAAVSALLLLAAVAACVRGHWKTDQCAFAVGSHFFYLIVSDRGVSTSWLSQVSAENVPPESMLGWSSRLRGDARENRVQINAPARTVRTEHFAGVGVSWGQGQILWQTWWLVYHASPLLPLHGVTIRWAILIAATTIAPALWLAARIRGTRAVANYTSPTLARAIQP